MPPAHQRKVRAPHAKTKPPGPGALHSLSNTLSFYRDPITFLTGLAAQYGDIARFSLLRQPVYLLNHPEYIRYVLQGNTRYNKDALLFRLAQDVLGEGIVSNRDEEAWRRQRHLLQPAFHKHATLSLTSLMLEETNGMLERWETYSRCGQSVDISDEMAEVTLHLVSKAIFHSDLAQHAQEFLQSVRIVNQFQSEHLRFPFPPLSVPLARHKRFWAALSRLDGIVYDIIRQRRQRRQAGDHDLLSVLLGAVDEETGRSMTDRQIRDEVLTFLIAGHETSANTLTCLWYLLSQHPAVEDRLRQEVREVLGDKPPTEADLSRLPYARMIIDEALRLYPPLWMSMRNTAHDDMIGGFYVPAKTWVFYSSYVLHRHPTFWEQPDRFDPERFAPGRLTKLSRSAYLPFGYGPHVCIGQHFALQEMMIILILVIQRYRLQLAPEHRVRLLPLVTLHMRDGLPMHLARL